MTKTRPPIKSFEDITIEVTPKGDIVIQDWEKYGLTAEQLIIKLRDVFLYAQEEPPVNE